jgi:hypothetical protein
MVLTNFDPSPSVCTNPTAVVAALWAFRTQQKHVQGFLVIVRLRETSWWRQPQEKYENVIKIKVIRVRSHTFPP